MIMLICPHFTGIFHELGFEGITKKSPPFYKNGRLLHDAITRILLLFLFLVFGSFL
jgi:hypothetical protein